MLAFAVGASDRQRNQRKTEGLRGYGRNGGGKAGMRNQKSWQSDEICRSQAQQ